jgi:Domain of unknown function (DUF5134)
MHGLMGVAMAGMLVPRLRVFWAGGWEVVFCLGAGWFAWLAIREFRARSVVRERPRIRGLPAHHLQHVLACCAMLYMLLAGTSAVTMGGTSATATGGMAAATAGHLPILALTLP